MGLCLFFCLSAYLITDLLLKERSTGIAVSVRKFYIRRMLRIWPLYFFGIALGSTWAFALNQKQQVVGFVWYLLFAGNIYCAIFGWVSNPFTPLWSISIEEQFYFVWPWAMRWFSRRGLFCCALLFLVLANLTLYWFGQHHADTDTTVWANTFVQFQMFATGILLALGRKRLLPGGAAAGLALVLSGPVLWFVACFVFHAKQFTATGLASSGVDLITGYALIALGCAAVLHGFCIIGPRHMPKWATDLGKISYGLYVYHLLAIEVTTLLFDRIHVPYPRGFAAPFALALTILAAKLSYAWLESPFLRFKRRFETVHSRPI
jgi:peptidoglycan/LPS O-acetylase OafA/YrhL